MNRSQLFEDAFDQTFQQHTDEQRAESPFVSSSTTTNTEPSSFSFTQFPAILDMIDEDEQFKEACFYMDDVFNKHLNKKSKERVLEIIKQQFSSMLCLSNDELNDLWIKANTCSNCQAVFHCKCLMK